MEPVSDKVYGVRSLMSAVSVVHFSFYQRLTARYNTARNILDCVHPAQRVGSKTRPSLLLFCITACFLLSELLCRFTPSINNQSADRVDTLTLPDPAVAAVTGGSAAGLEQGSYWAVWCDVILDDTHPLLVCEKDDGQIA